MYYPGFFIKIQYYRMKMTEKSHVSLRFKQFRKSVRLTQNQLANRLNVSAANICEIEKGKHRPSCEILERLALIFNANLYWLLFGQGEMFFNPGLISMDQYPEPSNRKEIDKFLKHFHMSQIVRYSVLSNYYSLMSKERENVEKEIEEKQNKNHWIG